MAGPVLRPDKDKDKARHGWVCADRSPNPVSTIKTTKHRIEINLMDTDLPKLFFSSFIRIKLRTDTYNHSLALIHKKTYTSSPPSCRCRFIIINRTGAFFFYCERYIWSSHICRLLIKTGTYDDIINMCVFLSKYSI